MPRLLRLLSLILLWTAAANAAAAAVARTEHVTVSLLADHAAMEPPGTLWLGLRFELIPHWHVYWRNPGDSGSAPSVEWALPPGWEAGPIRWPVPERIPVQHLTNYGYEGEVTLMVPVSTAPLPAGTEQVSLSARADWLVCREECIPEAATLDLELDLGRSIPNTQVGTHFDAARQGWPGTLNGEARYRVSDAELVLALPEFPAGGTITDLWFAAHQWGPVDPSGEQHRVTADGGLRLRVPTGDRPPDGTAPLEGLLVVETADGPPQGLELRAEPATAPPGSVPGPSLGLWTAVAFAFLGGLILNLMPCVLPVLAIKVTGFLAEAHGHRARLAASGLWFTAGVLLTFAAAALTLVALRAGGAAVGWGFQLQSPAVVAGLAYLMLAVGLALSGVFTLGGGLMGLGQGLVARGGAPGALANGALAVVVASPCTAPFMGAAMGYAFTRPTPEILAVFAALGTGFALPVLVLSLWPAWTRWVPSPGPWMGRLHQLLAFPMYATAAWLLWVLSQQTGPAGMAAALTGLVLAAFALWLWGQWPGRPSRLLAGGTLAAALALLPFTGGGEPAAGPQASAWSPERVAAARAQGRPVLVNFTAAWCITCKVNEQVALTTPAVTRALKRRGVLYLTGDWTRRDPVIARELERHGRNGVPLVLLYAPGIEQPRVLPQLLTESLVLDALSTL